MLTRAEYGGSGLGLYIARLLTRLHGGQIGAASVPGQGSKFVFYLKVQRSRLGTPEIEKPDAISPSHLGISIRPRHCSEFTIMIVEDNLGWCLSAL